MILMSDALRITLAIVIVALGVGLFIGTYLLNKRTKVPDNCPKLDCEGCSFKSCSKHPLNNKNKIEGDENSGNTNS